MKKKRYRPTSTYLFFITIFLAGFFCFSCNDNLQSDRIYFNTFRLVSTNENPCQCIYLQREDLYHLPDFLEEKTGFVTLESNFAIPESLRNERIGLYVGQIDLAAQIIINDYELGTCGHMPPNAFPSGYASQSFLIPEIILRDGNFNRLQIKIWVDGVGKVDERVFIGLHDDVASFAYWRSFINSEVNMLFTAISLTMAVFYFFLFLRRTREKEFLYYAFVNFFTGFFMAFFFQSEIIWLSSIFSTLSFNKIFLGISAFVTGYFATSFSRAFLHKRETFQMSLIRLALLIVPIIVTLLIPSYKILLKALPVLFVFIFFQIMFSSSAVISSIKRRSRHVAPLLIGFFPILVAVPVDFITHVFFDFHALPYFSIYGWQMTNLMFLFILASRYGKAQKQVEYLNAKLESKVVERTRELTKANSLLQREKAENAREMNLAVHVQRSFYPNDVFAENGWDVAVYFKPMVGVSGDLYDFYLTNKQLKGLCLFDVSGHGIAAGLVTMLSKNVIFNTWRNNLNLNISDVMLKINSAIIKAKGSIENYMTGILLRMVDETSGKIEFVNAGSPIPLLYKAQTGEVVPLVSENGKGQCGMIGVAELKVSFLPVYLEMQKEDCIIFYTDGITESQNHLGEDFGFERLKESFKSIEKGSAEKRMAKVMRDFTQFIGEESAKDDITLIVLRRSQIKSIISNDDDIEELEPLEELEEA